MGEVSDRETGHGLNRKVAASLGSARALEEAAREYEVTREALEQCVAAFRHLRSEDYPDASPDIIRALFATHGIGRLRRDVLLPMLVAAVEALADKADEEARNA